MPRGRPRKIKIEETGEEIEISNGDGEETPVQTEKEKLQALHKQLTDLGVNRISQLENLIAKAE